MDQVYLEAAERVAERQSAISPYRWLRRLARRVLAREVAQARQRQRELSLETPLAPHRADVFLIGTEPVRLGDVLPDPTAPVPSEVAESAEFQQALARILGRLPEVWREPFLLHASDGYSLREVAELEGARIADVRRRIERAREFLQAVLAEEYDEAFGAASSEVIFAATERAEPDQQQRERLVERVSQGGGKQT